MAKSKSESKAMQPSLWQLARLASLIARERSFDLSGLYKITPPEKPLKGPLRFCDVVEPGIDSNAMTAAEVALALWHAATWYLQKREPECMPADVEQLAVVALTLTPPSVAASTEWETMSKRVQAAYLLMEHCSYALEKDEGDSMMWDALEEEETKLKRRFDHLRSKGSKLGKMHRISLNKALRSITERKERKKDFLEFLLYRSQKSRQPWNTQQAKECMKLLNDNGVNLSEYRILSQQFDPWLAAEIKRRASERGKKGWRAKQAKAGTK